MPRAARVAEELLNEEATRIAELALVPSRGGRFEVSVDGQLLFSKLALERHAEPGEILGLFRERFGSLADSNA